MIGQGHGPYGKNNQTAHGRWWPIPSIRTYLSYRAQAGENRRRDSFCAGGGEWVNVKFMAGDPAIGRYVREDLLNHAPEMKTDENCFSLTRPGNGGYDGGRFWLKKEAQP